MKRPEYIATYVILLIAQVILWGICNFTQVLLTCILPSLILFLPTDKGTVAAMLIAFATGFAADFLGDGTLCLSVVALLPVALARRPIVSLVFGSEIEARNENITIARSGLPKVLLASMLANSIFLLLYIWIDGTGEIPFWYNLLKFAASLAFDTLLSAVVLIIISDSLVTRKWR